MLTLHLSRICIFRSSSRLCRDAASVCLRRSWSWQIARVTRASTFGLTHPVIMATMPITVLRWLLSSSLTNGRPTPTITWPTSIERVSDNYRFINTTKPDTVCQACISQINGNLVTSYVMPGSTGHLWLSGSVIIIDSEESFHSRVIVSTNCQIPDQVGDDDKSWPRRGWRLIPNFLRKYIANYLSCRTLYIKFTSGQVYCGEWFC